MAQVKSGLRLTGIIVNRDYQCNSDSIRELWGIVKNYYYYYYYPNLRRE